MNVAELSLCKELYELSGWHDTQQYGYQKSDDDYAIQYQNNKEARPGWWWYEGINAWAAYDLGYLLRKLPQTIAPHITVWPLSIEHNFDGRWMAKYAGELCVWADTPENAACKLAIELFKQGVLPKDKGEESL